MDTPLSNLDWSLMQTFLAVAETGSLSAAARRLGSSQPTVGRHVQALEDSLGVTLFHRQSHGMSLTDAGAALVPEAQVMRTAASKIALGAAGTSQSLAGTVRVTASVFVSHHVLPGVFARLRIAEPEIELELAPSDLAENLLFREADIAIRMFRPEQLDVITRHLGEVRFAMFASTNYLARRGRPESIADLRNHDLVGFDRDETMLRGFREHGLDIDRHSFATRCDAQAVYWELVKAGCGIGFCQTNVGRTTPGVEELPLNLLIPPLPIWLTAHEAMRRSARVRRIWDLLVQELEVLVS